MYTYKPLNQNKVLKSSDINNSFREIFNNLSDLQLKSTNATINQSMILDVVNTYSTAMSDILDEIQTSIANIDEKYNILTLYSTENIIYPTIDLPLVNHEPHFGTATLGIFSKKIIHSSIGYDGRYHPISNLLDYVNWFTISHIASDAFDRILENDIENAFDQDANTVFYRRLETLDDNINAADLTFEISFPAGERVNSLRIHPFPEGYINIDKITYSNSSNETNYLQSKDGFDINYSFNKARKQLINFKTIQPSVVTVKLNQPYRMGIDPYHFMLGLHNISFAYEVYENISYIGFQIIKPNGKSEIVKMITNLMENGDTDLSTGATYYIFTSRDDFDNALFENAVYNSDTSSRINPGTGSIYIPDEVSEIFILIKLIKDENENTPILRNLLIEWDD